jgi:cell division protein FtsX
MKRNIPEKNNILPKIRKDYRFTGLLVFAVALIAEMLIFINAQSGKLAEKLSDDFSLLLIAENGYSQSAMENLRIDIENVPGVEKAVFTGKKQLLERLKQEDPQLVDSVLSTGGNPLPDTWEVKVRTDYLLNLEDIAASLLVFDGVADVQYKKQEAWAVRHLLFYKHLTAVALSIAGVVFIVFVIIVLAHENSVTAAFSAFTTGDLPFVLSGIVAGAAALMATVVFLYPVKAESLFWSWTSPAAQTLFIICCAFVSWALRRWKLRR